MFEAVDSQLISRSFSAGFEVFRLLGDDVVNLPVGDEGLRPIHSAILNGSADMLEMVLKAPRQGITRAESH